VGAALAFVISLNLHRRHLDESQRAMVAAKLANTTHGGDRKSDQRANLPFDLITKSEAATMLNVSTRTVKSAKAVMEHGLPELIEAVEQGEIPVSAAVAIARLEAHTQHWHLTPV